MEANVIKAVETQEQLLLGIKERIELLGKESPMGNRTYQYERAKLIGMMTNMDVLKIDRSRFNWIS